MFQVELADQLIEKYHLNPDQSEAVHKVAAMFLDAQDSNGSMGTDRQAITLIHGKIQCVYECYYSTSQRNKNKL